VKSLIGWAEQVQAELDSQEPVRNVAGATDRQNRHLEMKSEIDARENAFAVAVESGRTMIANGHFASAEVRIYVSHTPLTLQTVLYYVLSVLYMKFSLHNLEQQFH